MPNPVDPIKNLAKFLANSKEKGRMYHATTKNFKEFKPSHRGAYFATPDTEFANAHVSIDDDRFRQGANVMPVHVQAENPFDYEKLQNLKDLFRRTKQEGVNLTPEWKRQILEGDWTALENEKIQRAIKNLGHDSFYVTETVGGEPIKNIGVFNPTQIKSAIGNRGTFDPLDPDITKAEGGQINPIKSPREMLFEMAGIPSMAGGKSTAGMEMYKLITDAIERYTKMYGRPPSPEDVAALKAHAKSLEPKPITSTPQVEARARHELATDPNLQNPDLAQDPFLTKMLTGRTTKGTYLKPKTVDITDPNVRQSIEDRQLTGRLDEIVNPESVTPSADYISRMATGVENEILGAGKVPLIDKLKQAFFKQNGRFPTQEELDTIIAEFNPARHQYGEKGASIVTERPPSRVGQAEWRARARMEGIPEAYLNKPPADYPQYLRDELDIKRGIQPGTAVRQERPYRSAAPGNTWDSITDELGNPIQRKGGGSSTMTPKEMEAMLAVKGRTPSFAKRMGKRALQGLNIAAVPIGAYETMEGAKETGRRLADKDYLGAMNKAISTAGSAMGTIPGVGLIPSLGTYALGEGFDYLTQPEDYSDAEYIPPAAKVLAAEDPRNKDKLIRPPTSLDYHLANQWVDAAKQR